jgi:hypothetical protein
MKQPDENVDYVHQPPHYTQGSVECIDAIEAALTKEEFIGFLKGTTIRYIWRLTLKFNPFEDIEKALWYAGRLRARLAPKDYGVYTRKKEEAKDS